MSEAKFTKGEWKVVNGKTYSCVRVTDSVVCDIRTVNCAFNEHDAHLIAAAPEMYEMLSKIHDYLEVSGPTGFNLSLDINDLLKKARGEK